MKFLGLFIIFCVCSLSLSRSSRTRSFLSKLKPKRQTHHNASPYSVVVSGANRGIGLALVKELLKHKDIQIVIATARNPAKATALKAISDPRLHIVALDVDNDASIRESYKEVEKIVGDHGLNVLVNNAGILLSYSVKPDGKIDRSILMKQFNTNVFGTVVVTQVYTPLLQKAAAHKKDDSFFFDRAAVVQISSYMGSIALNSWGSGARGIFMSAYRGSKAALNQFSRTFAHDLKSDHILSVAIHPGSVQTDMAGPRAALTAEQSARSLVNSFYKLNKSHNGNFYKEDLTPLPF